VRDGVPDGYEVEETEERVHPIGRRFFRFRAESLKAAHPPIVPSYRLRVEKVGFLLYEVVAYQNKLVKEDDEESIHNQVIGYLKGKAWKRMDEAANADDPLGAEHEAELLESAVLVLEKSG
jgi:hypothetical protein